MEYIPYLDGITFFQHSSKRDIDFFINEIIEIIEIFISESKYERVPKDVFLNKYEEIKESLLRNPLSKKNNLKDFFKKNEKDIIDMIPVSKIPVGFCHGDLTISNILFGKESKKISLIDFLDSFIETPLQDIVKIRQDTKYLWSTFLYKDKFDMTRHKMIMNYVDNKICNHFSKYSFFKHYKIFQIFNILRVAKYSKDEKVFTFLINTVKEMVK